MATRSAAETRRAELAQIHIGVQALGWSEEDYRAILLARTGQASAALLDGAGRRRFIAHLKASGWKNNPTRVFNQADKIRFFWRQLGRMGMVKDSSEEALLVFVGRTAGVTVANLKFLPTIEAGKVIEGLKAMLRRAPR